jgi:uroporphyrinogen-III synthase
VNLIITRPLADTRALKIKLEARGHCALVAPLMEIVNRTDAVIRPVAYQAVVLSSANAARALTWRADTSLIKSLTAYAPGAQSADAARASGFIRAVACGGDIKAVAQRIIADLKPEDGPVLYLSGMETAGDLEADLAAAGLRTHQVVLYDVVAAQQLPQDTVNAVRTGEAEGVLLYSPRTAAIWRDLTRAQHFGPLMDDLTHYCLSPSIAEWLEPDWPRRIAEQPEEESLMKLLDAA